LWHGARFFPKKSESRGMKCFMAEREDQKERKRTISRKRALAEGLSGKMGTRARLFRSHDHKGL